MTFRPRLRARAAVAGLLAGVIAAALAGLPAPAAHATSPVVAPSLASRIIGGVDASGNQAVLAIRANIGNGYIGLCSGALWKPTVVVTAAHCVLPTGSPTPYPLSAFSVFPAGANIAATAPVAHITAITLVQGTTTSESGAVPPDDIAIVVLDTPAGTPTITRLATQAEVAAAALQTAPVTRLGYGLTSPNGASSPTPNAVVQPLMRWFGGRSKLFSRGDGLSGVCSGDSGGPTLLSSPGDGILLVGPTTGTSGEPCGAWSPVPSTSGQVASAYPLLLNDALAAAGLPLIPSAPVQPTVAARDAAVTVSWLAPADRPEAAATYRVLDDTGVVLCQVAVPAFACTFTAPRTGTLALAVDAVNAAGDRLDAAPASPVVIGPPNAPRRPRGQALADGRVRISWQAPAPGPSGVVTGFRVVDAKGKVRCSAGAAARACTTRTDARSVRRFYVVATSALGTSPRSNPLIRG